MSDSIAVAWLREISSRYPAAWQPSQFRLISSHGLSASSVWQVETPAGAAALRCWAPWMTARRLQAIHHVLAAGHERGLTWLPKLIETADKATFCVGHGRLWEISRWIQGTPSDTETPGEDARREIMECLARWHGTFTPDSIGVSLDAFGDEAAVRAFRQSFHGPCRAWQRRRAEWIRLRATLADFHSINDDAFDLSRRAQVLGRRWAAWMDRLFQKDELTTRLVLCVGDIHAGNILLQNQRLAGVVDFEAVCLDSPARDVARLVGSLFPFDRSRWVEAIAWYDALMPLSSREKELIPVLDWSGAVIAALRWRQWLGGGEIDLQRRRAAYGRWRLVIERLEHPGNEDLLTK